MGRRGRERQLGLEDEYWRLILGGAGTVEAGRKVGITRKMGYRWRAEPDCGRRGWRSGSGWAVSVGFQRFFGRLPSSEAHFWNSQQ
jgi:hypothetical protein